MKWYIAIAHPQADVAQALDTLESKLVDLALTAGLDMSRFHLMDFGTRRRFSREVQETIVKCLHRNPGSWAPATTIGASAFPHADGTQAHEWFQAHQQISPDQPTASELHLLPGWKSIPTNLALH
ncbi:hypothetical protein ACLK2F_05385 [Escherichia coli]